MYIDTIRTVLNMIFNFDKVLTITLGIKRFFDIQARILNRIIKTSAIFPIGNTIIIIAIIITSNKQHLALLVSQVRFKLRSKKQKKRKEENKKKNTIRNLCKPVGI